MPQPRFSLGRLVATPGAIKALEESNESASLYVAKHLRGDWGEIDEVDREENELALKEGYRLFSVYTLRSGTVIWIITEADRSSTTILLPEEY